MFFFFFLQKNKIFEQINKEILFSGAIQSLFWSSFFEVNEKKLSNGLNFLKI